MLKAKYKAVHFIGVLICLGGVGLMVWADFTSRSQGPQPGTVLPAVLSVFKKISRKMGEGGVTFLSHIQFFQKFFVLLFVQPPPPPPPISIEERPHANIF